jgi:tRNA U34 5-methylaminomethyl-2-thiouridine-forming methyltransferase MnmC
MGIEIITTSDGSHSLLNTTLNETYHSRHGAVQESLHVFIKEGLDYLLTKKPAATISILEIGFGTGLNALLTAQRALEVSAVVQYTSLETKPLPELIWAQLNYTSSPDAEVLFRSLHEAPWATAVDITPAFRLTKRKVSLLEATFAPGSFDLIYFDAFAPNKQPEMWTYAVLETVVHTLREGGMFVTYCARGQLKRDLKALGLTVETLAGPPGKKEMVRGVQL